MNKKIKCWSRRRINGSVYVVCNNSKGQKKTKRNKNKSKPKKKIINKPIPNYSKVKSKYQQKPKSKKLKKYKCSDIKSKAKCNRKLKYCKWSDRDNKCYPRKKQAWK